MLTSGLFATTPSLSRSSEQKFPLHHAVKLGDVAKATQLIKQDELVNQVAAYRAEDSRQYTPLQCAILEHQENMVRLLLERKADVHVRDIEGNTILHLASEQNLPACIPLFIEQGILREAKNGLGETAVHKAAEKGHVLILKKLFDQCAPEQVKILINMRDGTPEMKSDRTSLHRAAAQDNPEVIELLLQHGAEINAVDIKGWTVLHYAAAYGKSHVTACLLRHGIDINIKNKKGFTAAQLAVQFGDKIPALKALLPGLKDKDTSSSEKKPKETDLKTHPETKATVEKAWHFDPSIRPTEKIEKEYVLLQPGPIDMKKVVEAYSHGPVPGYDVRSVQVIYNPSLNRSFAAQIRLLQNRHQKPAFVPKWSAEPHSSWRATINQRLSQMAAPYEDKEYPNVKILPVWHGTRPSIVSSLCETGFAALSFTDEGYFGRGLYSAYEANYSYQVYSKGALLMNWVACYSAYPVIDGDMDKLLGKANYQNYDAHFVPVVPDPLDDPTTESYVPCRPEQPARYHELVVFYPTQFLPRYIVELQPTLPKAPSMSGISAAASPHAFLAAPIETTPKSSSEKGQKKKSMSL